MKNIHSYFDDFMPYPSPEVSREVLWKSEEFSDGHTFSLRDILEHVPKDVSPDDILIEISSEKDYSVCREYGDEHP